MWSLLQNHKRQNLEFQMLATVYHKIDRGEYSHTLKWGSRFALGLNAAKISVISKNCSNKSCWEVNFVQKGQFRHISISPRSLVRGSKDGYVSNIILHWNGKVDSFLGRRPEKLPIISNNCSNKSCLRIKFRTKKSVDAHVFLPGVKLGRSKD